MVNANPAKQLQNVLPKCNPFASYIIYDVYGIVGLRRASTVFPTHLNISTRRWYHRCLCCFPKAHVVHFESRLGGFIHLAGGFILRQLAPFMALMPPPMPPQNPFLPSSFNRLAILAQNPHLPLLKLLPILPADQCALAPFVNSGGGLSH